VAACWCSVKTCCCTMPRCVCSGRAPVVHVLQPPDMCMSAGVVL
jgi:hypothetical protein